MKLSRALNLVLAGILGFAGIPLALATFDPIGEDIDIFLANPAVTAERPNVLIMLDNTANWNQAFTNEKSALVTVVNALSNDFNVGLMMYNESGQPVNHGAYMKFGVRQMSTANKNALVTMVNNLDILGDKGNNNTISEMIHEAYLYWAGLTPYTGWGQAKRDYPGNTGSNPLAASLSGNALVDATTPGTYVSPITNGCQKNFQLYISNGAANENAATLSDMQGKLAALVAKNPPDTITLSNTSPNSNSQQADWMDEFAKFMANNDCNAQWAGVQTVKTYVLEIDPATTGQGPGMTTLMKSVASNGGGDYFSASSANGGAEIVDKLNQFFQEIQSKNTVFASTTLPVSVNVRGTNLNQVYIGVFRPDANKGPRWFGNLKLYDLKVDTSNNLFLADANGNAAADSTTNFTKITAKSFWTTTSTFWSFRSPFLSTDIGGASDSPDGDLVEKGGVGERLRITYATDQSTRNLYTCTGTCACAGNYCATPAALSGSPFATTNANITALALGALLTKSVSSLGSVGNLATATSTAHGFATGDSIVMAGASPNTYNGTFTITVLDANTFTYTLPSSPSGNTATVAATAHNLSTNDLVDVTGSAQPGYNVTAATVTKVDNNSFTYTLSAPVVAASTGHTVVGKKLLQTLSAIGTTATATLTSHGYTTGNLITITGATPAGFNVTNASITATSANSFTFTTGSFAGTTSSTAQATTTTAHSFSSGETVTINCATPLAYNTTAVVTVIDTTNFQYTLGSAQSVDASVTTAPSGCSGATAISAIKAGTSVNAASSNPITHANNNNTATVNTSAAHPFSAGQSVTIAGANQSIYNGVVTIASVPTSTSFTYTKLNVGGGTTPFTPSPAGSATALVGATSRTITGITHPTTGSQASKDVATVTTSVAHGFAVNGTVTIAGTGSTAYDGTWTIVAVPTTTTFTFSNSGIQGATTPATGTITITGSVSRSVSALQRAISATGAIYAGKAVSTTSITSQTIATGTITAANQTTGDATARADIINWVRGQDNKSDENANSSLTDVRSTVHGDVLHSRPAVINYNRGGANGSNTGDDDVFAFYGSNDGVFRAIQGGFASNGGTEAWGFVPTEFFSKLKRLRDNTPVIGQTSGTSSPRDHFFDGPIGVYTLDVNGDGKILASAGDKVYLFIGMRRGGRYIYALDVSDPNAPKFMWKRGCPNLTNNTGCDTGFAEMGQTWSEPKVAFLKAFTNPVLIFGAGYDSAVEDFQPCLVTAMDSTSVTAQTGGTVTYTSTGTCTYSGTTTTVVNRSMGRGIFIVDAITGSLLFRFGGSGSGADIQTAGMDYAIPSDLAIVNRDGDNTRTLPGTENIQPRLRGFVDRIYGTDTGGNVWRIDVDNANTANWKVFKFASLSGSGLANQRKILFSPDLVSSKDANGNFDAVLVGTGDREHPFDATVTNRFYMLKDRKTGLDATGQATIVDSDYDATTNPNGLFDATSDCLQKDATGTNNQTAQCPASSDPSLTPLQQAQLKLQDSRGWKITFAAGEKDVGSATTLAGITFFNTNQPTGSVGATDCSSNLGTARQYAVDFTNATVPIPPPGTTANFSAAGRATIAGDGGYLPSPVPLIVEIDGKPYQAVISGTQIQSPGGITLGARIRTYWYRKLE